MSCLNAFELIAIYHVIIHPSIKVEMTLVASERNFLSLTTQADFLSDPI